MPWLDRLDTKAQTWPVVGRWSYLAIKWYLIGLGGFLLIRLSLDRTGIWPI